MPQGTLRVPALEGTRSVPGCIPTRSVGTISNEQKKSPVTRTGLSIYRSIRLRTLRLGCAGNRRRCR
ncbi:hypothetical protein DBV33_13785 [Pseudomonas fluorescens]|nr:hypothetical protein DBV33_13785 [Pseudomonas fluorescens]